MKKATPSNKDIFRKEEEYLMEAIQRTDTEKFYFLTSLIKKQLLMNKMKITHKD